MKNLVKPTLGAFVSLFFPKLCSGFMNPIYRAKKIICFDCQLSLPKTDHPWDHYNLIWERINERLSIVSFASRLSWEYCVILCAQQMGMNEFGKYFLFFLTVVSFTQCARKSAPTGGLKDTLPPVMINAFPKMNTVFFDKKKITIFFRRVYQTERSFQTVDHFSSFGTRSI